MNPLVSIVIPTYNREQYISQAIECAINQTYTNIEIIIGDNQSSDSTWNIISSYASKDPRIRAFQNNTNIGPVLNWNECFKRAKGEFLKIIWSDDYISLNYIEKTLSLFDKDTAFVISNIHGFDQASNSSLPPHIHPNPLYTKKQYLDDVFIWRSIGFPISPTAAIFRTKDARDNFVINIPNKDGLDSKINGAGNDQLLFLNTILSYKYIKVTHEATCTFRVHPGSFSLSSDLSLYYYWARIYYLKQYKNKIYSDILKYRLLKMSLRDKKFKNSYHAMHFSILCPLSIIICFISLFRKQK